MMNSFFRSKAIRNLCAVLVIILFIGLLPLHNPVANAETTINDSFQDGVADGWTPSGGSWDATTTSYIQSSATLVAISQYSDYTGTDYFMQAAVTKPAPGSGPFTGVVGRYTSSTSYYYAIYDRGTQSLVIGKRKSTAPNFLVLAEKPYTWPDDGTTRTLKLQMSGADLSLYVVGEPCVSGPMLTVKDTGSALGSGNTSPYVNGKAGLITYNSAATFDNVVISDSITAGGLTEVTATTPLEPQPIPMNNAVFVSQASPKAIPPYVFGVHDLQLSKLSQPTGNYPTLFDQNFALYAQDIKFQIIRGPGGTTANRYDWQNHFWYNPNDPYPQQVFAGDPCELQRAGTDYAKLGTNNTLDIPGIYSVANQLNLPYVFVVNVSTQDISSITSEVQSIKQNTSQPIFLEMGNELYDPQAAYMDAFADATAYMNKVKQIYQSVKAIDSSIQIGVVAPRYKPEQGKVSSYIEDFLAGHPGSIGVKRSQEWVDALKANENYFDAVIVHAYNWNSPSLNITNSANITPDMLMRYWFLQADNLEQGIVELSDKLDGKPVWVTEYSVFNWNVLTNKNAQQQFTKDPGAAIGNMQLFLNLLDSGHTTITSQHTMFDNQGFGILTKDGPNFNVVTKLPNYYTDKALGNLLSSHSTYYKLNLEVGGIHPVQHDYIHLAGGYEVYNMTVPDVKAWGFGDATHLEQAVLINQTDRPIDVRISGKSLSPVWTYGGTTDIYPNFPNNFTSWTSLPATIPVPATYGGTSFTPTVTLPPFTAMIANVQ